MEPVCYSHLLPQPSCEASQSRLPLSFMRGIFIEINAFLWIHNRHDWQKATCCHKEHYDVTAWFTGKDTFQTQTLSNLGIDSNNLAPNSLLNNWDTSCQFHLMWAFFCTCNVIQISGRDPDICKYMPDMNFWSQNCPWNSKDNLF